MSTFFLQSIDWLIDLLFFGWLFHWLIDRSIEWLIAWLIDLCRLRSFDSYLSPSRSSLQKQEIRELRLMGHKAIKCVGMIAPEQPDNEPFIMMSFAGPPMSYVRPFSLSAVKRVLPLKLLDFYEAHVTLWPFLHGTPRTNFCFRKSESVKKFTFFFHNFLPRNVYIVYGGGSRSFSAPPPLLFEMVRLFFPNFSLTKISLSFLFLYQIFCFLTHSQRVSAVWSI